jgi:uncharacterized protein (DUF697 family)
MAITFNGVTQNDATGLGHRYGTYVSSSTTATITTGLQNILYFNLQSAGSATSPYGTVSGGTITATTASSDTGYWHAVGF